MLMQIITGVIIGGLFVMTVGIIYVRRKMVPRSKTLVDQLMMSSTLHIVAKMACNDSGIQFCSVVAVSNGGGNPAIGKPMRVLGYDCVRPDVLPQGQGIEMDADYMVTIATAIKKPVNLLVEDMNYGLLKSICEKQTLRSVSIRVLHSVPDILFYVIFGTFEEKSLISALADMAKAEAELKRAIKSVF